MVGGDDSSGEPLNLIGMTGNDAQTTLFDVQKFAPGDTGRGWTEFRGRRCNNWGIESGDGTSGR